MVRVESEGKSFMRVVVDRDRYEGNAFCVNIAPAVFRMDADEYAVVTACPVPSEQIAVVEQAIHECPRAALHRED